MQLLKKDIMAGVSSEFSDIFQNSDPIEIL